MNVFHTIRNKITEKFFNKFLFNPLKSFFSGLILDSYEPPFSEESPTGRAIKEILEKESYIDFLCSKWVKSSKDFKLIFLANFIAGSMFLGLIVGSPIFYGLLGVACYYLLHGAMTTHVRTRYESALLISKKTIERNESYTSKLAQLEIKNQNWDERTEVLKKELEELQHYKSRIHELVANAAKVVELENQLAQTIADKSKTECELKAAITTLANYSSLLKKFGFLDEKRTPAGPALSTAYDLEEFSQYKDARLETCRMMDELESVIDNYPL